MSDANGRIRVGVNGYGVIGKRVAGAVARQDDMTLVGVAAGRCSAGPPTRGRAIWAGS